MNSSGENSQSLLRADRGAGAFQVAVGLFLLIVGSMMLVVPHQFESLTYAALLPHLDLWGTVFVLTAAGLLAVTIMSLPRSVELVAHLMGGADMIILAYSLALVGGWTGTINFGVMGLGTALAPFVAASPRQRSQRFARNWLATVVGLGSALTGVSILLLPGQFSGHIYDVVRSFLPTLGVAFFASGVLLMAANLRRDLPAPAYWSAHLFAGATLLVFVLISSLPLRAWIGIAYYGGIGVFVMLLPWLDSRLRRVDVASLRIRLAAALAVVAAVPLLFTLSYALDRQEDATIALALNHQQKMASSVAEDVSNYLSLHWSAAAGLAAQPGLLDAPVELQQQTLQAMASAYSDFTLIASVDLSGHMLARSDAQPPGLEDTFQIPRQSSGDIRPAVSIQVAASTGRPALEIASPVIYRGQPRGFIVATVDLRRVSNMLARARSADGVNTYLVDEGGRIIAHQDSALVASSTDFSTQPPVVAFLSRHEPSGALEFGGVADQRLAGYARVQGLGWGVVMEQSLPVVLSATRAQRDIAFAVLLGASVAAAGLGFWLAGYLVKPLRVLVKSVGEIASGRRGVKLPYSSITEVRSLSEAVGEMNEELIAAEAESERWLAAEQDARAQAEAAVRAREEFISVAAHELKTPVTSLRGYAQLIMYQFGKMGALNPERVAKAMEQVEQQTGRLTRLTDQLLNLSRLESGKLMLCPEETDVVALVASIVSTVSHSHPTREFDVRDAGPARAMIDPLRVEQVVTNLLDNAVKFSPREQPIEIEVGPNGAGWVRIAVRDYGLGIPEEKKTKVFERFYQAHAARHYGGMGIGLYISRQIVELHGGVIDLEQPEDGGTRFVLQLPVGGSNPRTVVEAADDGGESPSHPGGGRRPVNS